MGVLQTFQDVVGHLWKLDKIVYQRTCEGTKSINLFEWLTNAGFEKVW